MTKHKYEHKHRDNVNREINDVRVPYWQRAHRDWRFIAVVILMLIAITVYIMTGDLSWQNHGHVLPLAAP